MCRALVVAPYSCCPSGYQLALESCAVQVTITAPEGREMHIRGKPKGTFDSEVWVDGDVIRIFSPPPDVQDPLTEANPVAILARNGLSLDELGISVATAR